MMISQCLAVTDVFPRIPTREKNYEAYCTCCKPRILFGAAAQAAPAAVENKHSYVEYIGSFESGGQVYDVYEVTDLGGGYY